MRIRERSLPLLLFGVLALLATNAATAAPGDWHTLSLSSDQTTWFGWNHVFQQIDDFIKDQKPDSMEDIQTVWNESGSGSRNYSFYVFVREGNGGLVGPVETFAIEWSGPEAFKGLVLVDKDVKHRVLGYYNGIQDDLIFIIAVGPAANLKRLKDAGMPKIGSTAKQKGSH